MFQKLQRSFAEYPSQFWILMLASFIDRVGGALIFTFFSLYITFKFGVGLTEVGLLWLIFSVTGILGSFVGGALTDRFGRKPIVIASLVLTAISSLGMGLADSLNMLYVMGFVSGIVSNIGPPAMQALLADMLPEHQHTDGFAIWRVVFNVATMIGPVIGGLLASVSYLLLFAIDSVTSIIMALIIAFVIHETYKRKTDSAEETTLQTFKGYFVVFRDGVFLAFAAAGMVAQFVYTQMYSALPVFLRDVHAVPPEGFGWIMSMNATIVVVFQLWLTRKLKNMPPMIQMAIACAFYLVGFGMYAFVSAYVFFMFAMVLITIGEMIFFPTSQAIAVKLAPEDMRGRYMAIYGFSFMIPSALGTLAAGLIVDNYDPNLLWYACALGAFLSVLLYLGLHRGRSQEQGVEINPVAVGD